MVKRKTIVSKVIGEMTQDSIFHHWWRSEGITIPFFKNRQVEVIYVNEEIKNIKEFVKDADSAIIFFLSMDSFNRSLISNRVFKHYSGYTSQIESHCEKETNNFIHKVSDIWNFVNPNCIYLEKDSNDNEKIIIAITCNCLCDKDYKLQLIIEYNQTFTKISTHHEKAIDIKYHIDAVF